MIAKTAKWGNSIGVRLPKDLAKKAGIGVDSTVEIAEADDGIIIKSVGKKEYSLSTDFHSSPNSPLLITI